MKDLDILIVYPKTQLRETWPSSSKNPNKKFVVPYGAISLATILDKHGYIARAVELDSRNEKFGDLIEKYQPRFVGLSIMCDIQLENSREVIIFLREKYPKIKTIIGGQGATYYEDFFEGAKPDYRVSFSGWLPILEIVSGATLEKNIDGKIFQVSYPPADWNLFDHNSRMENYEFFLPLSIGCSHDCFFCAGTHFWQERKKRFLEDVVIELQGLHNLGVKEVIFSDDNFSFEIADSEFPSIPGVNYIAMSRVDTILAQREESLFLSHKKGLRRIFIGVESGSGKVLKSTNRHMKLQEIFDAVIKLKKIGFEVGAFFILGLPFAMREDDLESLKFYRRLKSVGLDFCYVYHYRILRGSAYEKILAKKRILAQVLDQKKLPGSGNFQKASYDTLDCFGNVVYSHEEKDELFELFLG